MLIFRFNKLNTNITVFGVTWVMHTFLQMRRAGLTFVLAALAFVSAAEAARKSPQILFVDRQTSHIRPCIQGTEIEVRGWTPDEREVVLNSLEEVLDRAPWLVSEFENQQSSLSLFRVGSAGQQILGLGSAAYAGANFLLFSDEFFQINSSERLRVFLHELVHFADVGYDISYTKAWVDFCNVHLSPFKVSVEQMSPTERNTLREYCSKHRCWPTIYSTENLSEALAEFVSIGTLRAAPDSSFLKCTFMDKLLRPDASALNRRRSLRRLKVCLNEHHWDELLRLCDEFRAAKDQALFVDYCLWAYLDTKKDFSASTKAASNVLMKANELGIYCPEFAKTNVLFALANYDLKNQRADQAILRLNEVIADDPTNLAALRLRAHCNFKLGARAEALQDLFDSQQENVECTWRSVKEGDKANALALVDEKFTRGSVEYLHKKGLLFTRLALLLDYSERSKYYLEEAFSNLSKASEITHNNRYDLLIACADLSYRRGNYSVAQKYCSLAKGVNSDGLPHQLIQLRLDERLGKKSSSQRFYVQLLRRLLSGDGGKSPNSRQD